MVHWGVCYYSGDLGWVQYYRTWLGAKLSRFCKLYVIKQADIAILFEVVDW